MTKDAILVVSQTNDAHADDVVRLLDELGHSVTRLNTDEFPSYLSIDFSFGPGVGFDGAIDVSSSQRHLDLNRVKSVWWRRPKTYTFPMEWTRQEIDFARDETEHAFFSAWSCLDTFWVSHPDIIRRSSWKGYQLQVANQVGFVIPLTLITTSSKAARSFYDGVSSRGKQVVFKVMSDPYLKSFDPILQQTGELPTEAQALFTTVIGDSELSMLESVMGTPCLLQEYVDKRAEYRVTVIGSEVYSVRISATNPTERIVDWRTRMDSIDMTPSDPPPSVIRRCHEMLRLMGLNFGVFDLILNNDDEYVFLEINPVGQFIFLEEIFPELRMTEALAALLVRASDA